MSRSAPRVVVNFKAYAEATGRRAVTLAKAAARLGERYDVAVAVAPQAVDVRLCVDAGARVFAQHFDEAESPASTGSTRWESLVDAGVEGTLLNHSEKRIHPNRLLWYVDRVRRSGLSSLVCAHHDAEARKLANLRPTLLAVEPPELIGGTVSVTTADPDVVRRSVHAVHEKAPQASRLVRGRRQGRPRRRSGPRTGRPRRARGERRRQGRTPRKGPRRPRAGSPSHVMVVGPFDEFLRVWDPRYVGGNTRDCMPRADPSTSPSEPR